MGGEGGAGPSPTDLKKSSDVVFFSFPFCKSSAYSAEAVQWSWLFQRKLLLNYNFPIFHGEGRYNISRGSNFSRGRGCNCIFLYKTIEFVIFQGAGSGPLPPPLDPRLALLTEFVHTSSWAKDIAWHSLHWCKFRAAEVNNDRVLLFSDWRYAWGIKNTMSRVVHRVSKAILCNGILYYFQRRMWRQSLQCC